MRENVLGALMDMATAQYTRDDFAWGNTAREIAPWAQVSGDIGAATYGATFGRVVTEKDKTTGKTRSAVELVKVYNWEEASGETLDDPEEQGPYMVETYTLEPHLMYDTERAQYFDRLSTLTTETLTRDISVDDALMALALSISDYLGMEQTSVGGGQFQTLGDAMRSQDIPQAALWRPEEYTVRAAWGATCRYVMGLAHPYTNHLAELAVEAMLRLDNGDTSDEIQPILKHMEAIAGRIDRNAQDVPQWYRDNSHPCDAWRTLETF